ncbi:dethiobiotin synthase [Acaryochloris sp. IP29b_bin.137]|uniref:dethiobiotin synthase n=1 Tax=Acaryochloris sp. IP29b_bin.137 TaxID=2969217 RepID=UPI002633502B|nr:dethiobiotin synthase [Acaryochloris sp. IP29b_bin.137]
MAQTLLISGTDTEIGKTIVTSALLAYWQRYRSHERIAVCKPVQSGPGDREWYSQVFELQQSPETLNPLYYDLPLAPPLAAKRAGQIVDLLPAWQAIQQLQTHSDWVFVEGVGSLGSPVTEELIVADLAKDWRLPIVLVVPIRLGCVGQSVAHIALARQFGLDIKGIVLNATGVLSTEEIQQWAPIDMIQALTQVPVIGQVPHLSDPSNQTVLAEVASGFDLEALGSLSYTANLV